VAIAIRLQPDQFEISNKWLRFQKRVSERQIFPCQVFIRTVALTYGVYRWQTRRARLPPPLRTFWPLFYCRWLVRVIFGEKYVFSQSTIGNCVLDFCDP
jgi:hypothetical protein